MSEKILHVHVVTFSRSTVCDGTLAEATICRISSWVGRGYTNLDELVKLPEEARLQQTDGQ